MGYQEVVLMIMAIGLTALGLRNWHTRMQRVHHTQVLTDTDLDLELADLLHEGFRVESRTTDSVTLVRPRPYGLLSRRPDVVRLELNADGSITRLG